MIIFKNTLIGSWNYDVITGVPTSLSIEIEHTKSLSTIVSKLIVGRVSLQEAGKRGVKKKNKDLSQFYGLNCLQLIPFAIILEI